MARKRASSYCILSVDSGLTIEPTEMEEVFSILLGAIEKGSFFLVRSSETTVSFASFCGSRILLH